MCVQTGVPSECSYRDRPDAACECVWHPHPDRALARGGGISRSGSSLGAAGAVRRSGSRGLVAWRSGWLSHDWRRQLCRRHEPPHPPATPL